MRDYAEIAHNLRCCGVDVPCDDCTYRDDTEKCVSLEGQAADAIEELLKENGELENSGRVLMAAFARLKEKVPHWISVEERLPEENKNYLCYGVFLPLGVKAMDMYRFDGVRWRTSSDVEITHWMPLPEAPKEVE